MTEEGLLYPRLPKTVADELARAYQSLPIEELRAHSAIRHPAVIYAPTGGSRVENHILWELQQQMRDIARQSGYPEALSERSRFDARSGQFLHEQTHITPAEAASQGIWMFMGCVLLPDIVRWRFPGDAGGTSRERFLGGNRGLRNTFGRVWWRAHVLKQPEAQQSYQLLDQLGEDELVQIMERPSLAGSPLLARQVCFSFLHALADESGIMRSELLRDVMKRLRRLLPLVAFDALDATVLASLVNDVVEESMKSLRGAPGNITLAATPSKVPAQASMAAFERPLAPSINVPPQSLAPTIAAMIQETPAQQTPAIASKTKQQWLVEGNTHHNEGRDEAALADYEQALKLDPGNAYVIPGAKRSGVAYQIDFHLYYLLANTMSCFFSSCT